MAKPLRITFKPSAQKQLYKLDKTTQRRIAQKLMFYVSQPDPLNFAVKMADSKLDGEYRFRVGDYRVVFDKKGQKLVILKIQHRREIYKH